MYNSSLKGHGGTSAFKNHIEVPHKIFFNDMSKSYMQDEFKTCDVIYSEIAWPYGYKGFNEKAGNVPSAYSDYVDNINLAIEELDVPAFIVCGKNVKKHFPKARMYPITITTSGENIPGCTLFVWKCGDFFGQFSNTIVLLNWLAARYDKCLDPSCGYGEHLLKFKDFVGCDVNRDCLTHFSILYQEIMAHG